MRAVERDEFRGSISHAAREDGSLITEIMQPAGWTAFWREDPSMTLFRPEMLVIDAVEPYLDPPRTNGQRGLKVFKLFSRHDAGYWKQFEVAKGTRLVVAKAQGHAWYSQRDNAHASEYKDRDGNWHQIHDGEPGMQLWVGIDPTGGTDPWASSVVWNYARIYDEFDWTMVDVPDPAETITVFLRSDCDHPFKHADAYWAAFELEALITPEHEDPADYIAVVNLLPPDATVEEAHHVSEVTHESRETFVYSAKDAVRLVRRALPGSFVRVWAPDRWPDPIVPWLETRGVFDVRVVEFDGSGGPEPEPEPGELRFTYPTTFMPPVITSPYGPRRTGFHYGVDLRSSWRAWRTEVLCALEGEVVIAGIEPNREYFGYSVVVRTERAGDVIFTRYAHLIPAGQGGVYVEVGDRVHRGQKLGRPNNTGVSWGDHLHFDVRINGRYVNPTDMIDWPDAEPTPPPSPPAEPTLPELGTTNLIGLHSGFPKDGWDTYYGEARPSVGKFFELGHAMQAKTIRPDALIVYRYHVHNDAAWINVPNIRESAEAFLDLYSYRIDAHAQGTGIRVDQLLASIDVLESVNEVVGTFTPQIFNAVEFDVEFCDAVKRRYGDAVKAGILTVAIGNPHESEVAHLLPAARKSYEDGHYLAYHPYWTGNRLRPSPSWLERHWPYHAGRWQEWDRVFREHGVYPRYYLGEAGIVYAPDPEGVTFDSGLGWRSCGPFAWYVEQILIFNERMRQWNRQHGNRCRGATIFAYGQWGWEDFDFEPGDLAELREAIR